MGTPDVTFIQLFRVNPGDVGLADIPCLDGPVHAEIAAVGALRSYADHQGIDPALKPHHVRVIDANGRLFVEYMMTPQGPERVQ